MGIIVLLLIIKDKGISSFCQLFLWGYQEDFLHVFLSLKKIAHTLQFKRQKIKIPNRQTNE
jgi:hypothetical protein